MDSRPKRMAHDVSMRASLLAGLVYFALLFGIGFVLGTIRVLALVPRVGAVTATLIELPIILLAAWIVCARLTVRLRVPADLRSRVGMGAFAFALLMLAELGVSLWLFGNSLGQYLEQYRTPHGVLGLGGQLLFAVFPVLQIGRKRH